MVAVEILEFQAARTYLTDHGTGVVNALFERPRVCGGIVASEVADLVASGVAVAADLAYAATNGDDILLVNL